MNLLIDRPVFVVLREAAVVNLNFFDDQPGRSPHRSRRIIKDSLRVNESSDTRTSVDIYNIYKYIYISIKISNKTSSVHLVTNSLHVKTRV